jgi:hypothetical protein
MRPVSDLAADEEVRECYEEVAHHGCDAFRIQNFGIAARSVMHDLRAYNIPQHHRISTMITSSCHARAIAVLSTWVVAGQAAGGAGCASTAPTLQDASPIAITPSQRARMYGHLDWYQYFSHRLRTHCRSLVRG